MNGIYTRDQLNLQSALADALNRRERQMQRQADRNTANTEAIQNLMKAGGRWYETSDTRTIDERIAELEKEKQLTQAAAQDKAQLDMGIPTRLTPEYRAGRFDYIVEGNRSGLDAYQQAVNAAVNNKLQRDFQNQQRLANEAFQSAENEKNRAVQREQAGITKATEKAKMLRDYADAQALVSDIEQNPANYGSKVAIETARAKNNLKMVKQNMIDSGMFTEADLADPVVEEPAAADKATAPDTPVADWNKDRPEIERLIGAGKYDEAEAILSLQNKDDAGLQSDWQKLKGQIDSGRKKDAKKAEAKRFKSAKVAHVKKSLPSTIEVRKALDMGKAGGGKSEGVIKGKTFLYGKTNKEIGDIVVKKDGNKAKLYVDGEYVGEVSLDF